MLEIQKIYYSKVMAIRISQYILKKYASSMFNPPNYKNKQKVYL